MREVAQKVCSPRGFLLPAEIDNDSEDMCEPFDWFFAREGFERRLHRSSRIHSLARRGKSPNDGNIKITPRFVVIKLN